MRLERWAAAIFLAIAVPVLYLGAGERSAYLQTFSSYPGGEGTWGPGQASFGLFGGAYIIGDRPLMAENALYIAQILMFNGDAKSVSLHFTATRPIYAFAASVFAPALGVMGSQVFVNFLGWAAAVWITWRFTLGVFGDRRAALIASTLASGGLGFVIHSHDYSPHLIPFAVYYLGTLIVYESRVWAEERPVRVHLILGLCLALACLTYTMELALVLAYALVAGRRNRWPHVGCGMAIALTSTFVYTAWLNLINSAATRRLQWSSVDGTESYKLQASLDTWLAQLAHPSSFLELLVNGLAQFSFFEFPLLVVAGLLSWRALPRTPGLRWFFAAFFFLPMAGGLAYLNQSTTRGYMVYGISLLIYAPLGAALARGVRAPRRGLAVASAGALIVIVGVQLFWSTAFLWHYAVPAKAFFGFGFLDWIPKYVWQLQPATALSLTGLEPTPVMFGGTATLRDAGMLIGPPPAIVRFTPLLALLSRVVIVCYATLLALLLVPRRHRVAGAGGVVLVLGLLPVALPQLWPPRDPVAVSTFYTTMVPPLSALSYRVGLSDSFVAQLRSHEPRARAVAFVTPGIHAPFEVRVTDGNGSILAETQDGGMLQHATASVSDVVAALDASRQIELVISTFDVAHGQPLGTAVFGWQRNGLAGRRISNTETGSTWDSPLLPALEVRLLDTEGRTILIGF